jgi:lipoprotein-anchoring transpeptidase ErfK/SrfK
MSRWACALLCAAAGVWLSTTPAAAEVVINVDKASQRMTVTVDGAETYTWPVSTGIAGGPPAGAFRPQRLERSWYSHLFHMAPMPHAIFFRGPFAIHGTTAIARLGQRASHGCVRLHPDNAATLFALVERQGAANTRILISR